MGASNMAGKREQNHSYAESTINIGKVYILSLHSDNEEGLVINV